jgi:hypothetical protein
MIPVVVTVTASPTTAAPIQVTLPIPTYPATTSSSPTTTSSQPAPGHEYISTAAIGAIVGGVVGGIIVLTAIIGFVYLKSQKYRYLARASHESSTVGSYPPDSPSYSMKEQLPAPDPNVPSPPNAVGQMEEQ